MSANSNVKQGERTSKHCDSSRTIANASSESVLSVTLGKRDPTRLGLAGSQSILRPVKHVKPIPRKPLAMDMEPVHHAKQNKDKTDTGNKLKPMKKFETVSKSVFDRLGN